MGGRSRLIGESRFGEIQRQGEDAQAIVLRRAHQTLFGQPED